MGKNRVTKMLFLATMAIVIIVMALALFIPGDIRTRQVFLVLLGGIAIVLMCIIFHRLYKSTWKNLSELKYVTCKFFICMSILAVISMLLITFAMNGDVYVRISSMVALSIGTIVSLAITYRLSFKS